jgi:hypothetical protein
VSTANQGNLSVDFGTPPAGLTNVAAVLGIELGDQGIALLPIPVGTASPTLLAPKVAAFAGGTGFRMIGIANDGATTNAAQSVVLRRGLAGPTLSAGTWLAVPSNVSISRTSATWTPSTDATVSSIELKQGGTAVLAITVLDGSTSATVSDLLTLPSGSIDATVQAIGATGFDVTNFALDTDLTKLDRVAAQARTIQ